MKLSDIMAHAGLSGYAEVALVLFLVAFLAILWWVLRPANRKRWEADGKLPLDEPKTRTTPEHDTKEGNDV